MPYDAVAHRYDEHFERALCKAEDRVLYSTLGNPRRLLDLGCGTGNLLNYVSPYAYMGVDISAEMLREARRKFQRYFFEGRAEEVGGILAPGYFDVVCSFWSFPYFDARAALQGMYRTLKRGGKAIVHAYSPRYVRRSRYILEEPPAAQDPEELRLMMYGAGFRWVEARPFRVLPDWCFKLLSPGNAEFLLRLEMENLPPRYGMTYLLIGGK